MSEVILELIVVFGLVLLNGFFAMAELAVVSARKVRLKQSADEGNGAAQAALELAEDPTQFLSTVQVGITLVGVMAGAYGGATLADRVAPLIEPVPIIGVYAHGIAFVIVVAAITFLSLVIGELVPKRFALTHPERIAMGVARIMKLVTKVFSPVVKLLAGSTEVVFRLARVRPPEEPPVTDEEIKDLMEQGTEAGQFHETEAEIVSMTLRLGDRRVSSLMTPRTLMDWLDVDEPDDVNRRKIVDSPHSRFPLVQGGLEHVLGIVQVKDLLASLLSREKFDMRGVAATAPFIPETAPALKALELFKSSGAAMALVVDEYGAITGLLTLNDILEALVGDISAPNDPEDPSAVRRDDGSWLVDGMLPIDQLRDLIDGEGAVPESNGEYNTVAGFVMMQLKRVPKIADHIEISGFRFEVIDMDGRRIDKVLVVPPPPPPQVNALAIESAQD